jgi:hypothetical protein
LNHFQFRIGRILEFVGLFDSTWWWKEKEFRFFSFFFFIVVVITIDTCYMYACAYLMRCSAKRTNERTKKTRSSSFFFIFFLFRCVSFFDWVFDWKITNRDLYTATLSDTHTHWERVQMGAFFLQPRPAKKTRHSWRRPRNEKKISISINRS